MYLSALTVLNADAVCRCRVNEQWRTSFGAAGDVASLSVVKPRVIYMWCLCGHMLGHW